MLPFLLLFEHGLQPAMRIDGQLYTGATHLDCLRAYVIDHQLSPEEKADPEVWLIALDWVGLHWTNEFLARHSEEEGFLDMDGIFHSREEARALLTKTQQNRLTLAHRDWVDSTDLDY